uniref:Uncharacterized protein n=1 Tax=Odontella aurita TaxID=265563 RepID=A0A7S4JSX6_9STRA|mmetsp:Transcript_53521/g.160161  ORF Transcript_53521/g.160161 Transcript_53521/m.160161 type:complete len:375 (+) Transcript_53521:304-1428(+)
MRGRLGIHLILLSAVVSAAAPRSDTLLHGILLTRLSLHIAPKNVGTKSTFPTLTADLDLVLSLRGGAKEEPVANAIQQKEPGLSSHVVSAKVRSVGKTYRHVRRKQFFTMVLLRLAFVLMCPMAAIVLVITVALSLVLTALRIVFLNFCFRDTSRIVYAATRAALAILLACITGLLSPPFAVFGVLAAVSLAGLDMAEPLLRIRYRRQMRKLRHLHRLITDPVLMETMEVVLRGAQAVASASARAAESSRRGAIGLTSRGQKAIGQGAASLSRQGRQAMDGSTANELVETLLESTGAVRLRERVQNTMPSSVAAWAEDQYQSLRRSGAFEAIISRALDALGKELSGAAEFLPYLEAIEVVRRKQRHAVPKLSAP